jgi:hypothetical protein
VEASLPNEAKASANSVRLFVVLLKQRRRECRLHPSFSAGGKYFKRAGYDQIQICLPDRRGQGTPAESLARNIQAQLIL